jgi:hypothetical protein
MQEGQTKCQYLWQWQGNLELELACVVKIPRDNLPPLYAVSGLAETEAGLTLTMEDERFIFFEKNEQGIIMK